MTTRPFAADSVKAHLGTAEDALTSTMTVLMKTNKHYTDGTLKQTGQSYPVTREWGKTAVEKGWASDPERVLPVVPTPAGLTAAQVTATAALLSGAVIADTVSRAITALDNGKSLAPTGALAYTIPAGLTPMPSFTVDCPAIGTISIASSGGALLNGAVTTLTRARAVNPVGFVVLAHSETDSYGVSGT